MTNTPTVVQRVCLELGCGCVHIKYRQSGKHIIPNELSHDCEQGSSEVL